MPVLATCLGYPRIGADRQLKTALERYWKAEIDADGLQASAAQLRRHHWLEMQAQGIEHIPSNDFSLYDHVLDMAVMVDAVPERYRGIHDPLRRYFAMARGLQDPDAGLDVAALEMTKWFDTNYHYIVPDLAVGQTFALHPDRVLDQIGEAREAGVEPRPVILGPVTFLMLSKMESGAGEQATTLDLLDPLLEVYEELFSRLAGERVEWIQFDEPCLVMDLDEPQERAYRSALSRLAASSDRPRVVLTTYFGAVGDNLVIATGSGFEALHLDLVRAPEQLDAVLPAIDSAMTLSLGVIDGRNIWRADLDAAHEAVRRAVAALGEERVLVATSCSLLHVPVDLEMESSLDAELKSWLAFARQKLREIRAIAELAGAENPADPRFDRARAARASRRASPLTADPEVRRRAREVTGRMLDRTSPRPERAEEQRARFALPSFPTTTIGSFPQTAEVRRARADWRAGRVSTPAYDAFLLEETARCVERQERIGLDVIVHGELERNDMVEHFGEKLSGFALTAHGWVQSYGSRCVKPPLLYGDVSRPGPMTVEWSSYARSLTSRPVKGMLTGPVTILQWSFVRDDQPRKETCRQIALALRDEVMDLEAAGIEMIQIDEPAIREGLPIRRADRAGYLRWAVDAFRLATSGVRDETQIHTHMCYSEFGDILGAVEEMDADVLSIETSRSNMELLTDLARHPYPSQIGPGVYDIHSPRVPTPEEMVALLRRATELVPGIELWVNPDCGLKTRAWPEVEPALANMVEAARRARAALEEDVT